MSQASHPRIEVDQRQDYREGYANSVQVRGSVFDFLLTFGVIQQNSPDLVSIHNFQGIYLSPQQCKALVTTLQQHITEYEAAFGEIRLEPQAALSGGGTIQ